MSNDNQEVPNPILRAASTQTAFHIWLSTNQVAGLDCIAHGRREMIGGTPRSYGRGSGLWVPTMKQLSDKGFVTHKDRYAETKVPVEAANWGYFAVNDYYRLTKAGWAMFDMLVEAGFVLPVTAKRRLVA